MNTADQYQSLATQTKPELQAALIASEMRRQNADIIAKDFYDELLSLRAKLADVETTLARMQRAELETQLPTK